jgi:hypothetical protein
MIVAPAGRRIKTSAQSRAGHVFSMLVIFTETSSCRACGSAAAELKDDARGYLDQPSPERPHGGDNDKLVRPSACIDGLGIDDLSGER